MLEARAPFNRWEVTKHQCKDDLDTKQERAHDFIDIVTKILVKVLAQYVFPFSMQFSNTQLSRNSCLRYQDVSLPFIVGFCVYLTN